MKPVALDDLGEHLLVLHEDVLTLRQCLHTLRCPGGLDGVPEILLDAREPVHEYLVGLHELAQTIGVQLARLRVDRLGGRESDEPILRVHDHVDGTLVLQTPGEQEPGCVLDLPELHGAGLTARGQGAAQCEFRGDAVTILPDCLHLADETASERIVELTGEPASIIVEFLALRTHGALKIVDHGLGEVAHRPSPTVITRDAELARLVEKLRTQLVHLAHRGTRGLARHVFEGHGCWVVDERRRPGLADSCEERLHGCGDTFRTVLGEHVVVLVLELLLQVREPRLLVPFRRDPLLPQLGLGFAGIDDGLVQHLAHLDAQHCPSLWGVLGHLGYGLLGGRHGRVNPTLDQGAVIDIPGLRCRLESLGVTGAREQCDVAPQHIEALHGLALGLQIELAAVVGQMVLQRPEGHGAGLLGRREVLGADDTESLVHLVDLADVLTGLRCHLGDHFGGSRLTASGGHGSHNRTGEVCDLRCGARYEFCRIEQAPGHLGTHPLPDLPREQGLCAHGCTGCRCGCRDLDQTEPHRHGLGALDHAVEQLPRSRCGESEPGHRGTVWHAQGAHGAAEALTKDSVLADLLGHLLGCAQTQTLASSAAGPHAVTGTRQTAYDGSRQIAHCCTEHRATNSPGDHAHALQSATGHTLAYGTGLLAQRGARGR